VQKNTRNIEFSERPYDLPQNFPNAPGILRRGDQADSYIRNPCSIRKTAAILFEIVRNRVLIADRYGDDGQRANHERTRWESDDSCGSNWLTLGAGHG